MVSKEQQLSASQRKQPDLDLILPAKRLLNGEIKNVESNMLDIVVSGQYYCKLLLRKCFAD